MPSRKGKGYENKAKNLCQSDLKNRKMKAITRVKTCLQHSYELNWSDLQQLDPFKPIHDEFIGYAHQRHNLTGCSETRTIGAQSVCAL